PLGMADTGFKPPERLRGRVAPTTFEDGHWLTGEVHDPRARKMGGVAGHAGLFSTADDLSIFARTLTGGGTFNGKRILSPESVWLMTTGRPIPTGLRSYGFDVDTSYSANRGSLFARDAGFGHTGYTGTSIWVDPPSKTVVIFLSNRVHPDEKK